ncbi:MAG: response regulator, partial [Myxococcota bacterium]
ALATSALPALTKLDVQNNRCTARGLSSLLEAPFVEKLHTLRVRNNPLGPAGGTVLGAWLGPGPATLDLTRCELEDAGLQAIAQGPLAGSVETLALGQNGLTGAHLARFTELRSVDLTRNRGLRTAHLSAAASRWTSLKLDGCGLDDASLDALVAPALRTLSMPRNPDVTCDGPRFASLGELRSLDLSGCGVETPGWHTLATALPRLERLQLNKCAIEGFAGTPRGAFPTLRALHLASNPIGEDARALADVALPALRTLRVSLCGIGGALGAWSRAPWFAQLQELDVSGQAIDPTDLRAGRSLERLDMSHTGLTGSLDVLWELPGLQILTASHNRLGNEGVFAGAGHPNLRQLNLANNALDNTPVPGRPDERLRFPRLQHLNLRVNGISPSVEAALRQTSSRVLLDADERPPSSVHEDLSWIRVLLGDDGPMNRDMVRRRLSRRGARVTAVHDDALAPKLVASQPFDVVLLQPRHDAARSWRVVRALREAHPELPVVAYCGYGQLADREAALEAGCTEYLGERMDFDRLVAVIRAHAPAAESAGA